ncbi:MAG: FAD:protein FMN transferase [Gammaproteobacteria bacterium]|nr:FAD:protein FMN transferase [Gammaproteobacteria bacterium]
MNRLNALFLSLCLTLGSTGCTQDTHREFKRTILKFGTLIDITLYDVEPALAERALDQLETNFNQYHADWTSWQDSPLMRANEKLALGEPVKVDASIAQLIQRSQVLSQNSHGLFNPSINQLISLWQMHRSDETNIQPPEPQVIQDWLKTKPNMNDLKLDGLTVRSRNPAAQLNFGAFAKGYAIDLSFDYLRILGIHNAVINAGGDLSVRGRHGDRPWKIGIRHPREENTIAWLEAQDGESIVTSGDYERFYIYKGRRYHHILDPRTGYPAEDSTSVTVIHHNAGTADAAATALFVAGPKQWQEIAKSMGIEYVMLIDDKNNIYMSRKMAERVHFSEDQTGHILVSESL